MDWNVRDHAELCNETEVHNASTHIAPLGHASWFSMSGTAAPRLVLALTRNSELRLATVCVKICNSGAGFQKAVHKKASQSRFAHTLAANHRHMRAASLPHCIHNILCSLHCITPVVTCSQISVIL